MKGPGAACRGLTVESNPDPWCWVVGTPALGYREVPRASLEGRGREQALPAGGWRTPGIGMGVSVQKRALTLQLRCCPLGRCRDTSWCVVTRCPGVSCSRAAPLGLEHRGLCSSFTLVVRSLLSQGFHFSCILQSKP